MKNTIAFVLAMAVMGANAQGLLRRPSQKMNSGAPAAATPGGAAKTSTSKQTSVDPGGRSIEFNQAALDLVFKVYGELVNKTVLKDPQAPQATITLQPKQGQELTDEEKILAIETVLEMNGIHLENYGEKFVRAIPRKDARKEGIPLILDPEAELGETTRVVSFMLQFKNIGVEDAQKALDNFKSANGIIIGFERNNSLLLTDTEANVNRMREIAREIDIATPVLENVFVRQIKNASAEDIKTALEAIVQESQKDLSDAAKKGNVPGNQPQQDSVRPFGRNILGRNNQQQQAAAPAANESKVMGVSDADRGMIRGKVMLLADERSNKLIVITSKSNMDFFDKVIEQLDIETTPDTVVKVYRLKYADSEDVSDMINDLIGNSSTSKNSSKGSQNATSKNAKGGNANMTRNSTTQAKKASANQRTGEPKAGELSKDNTTILSDKRINGLVVMTNKELIPTIESIIESMDIKLSQVMIETVIVEVGLSDELKTGIDWVKGMATKDGHYQQAIGGGGGTGKATSSGDGSYLTDIGKTALPSIFSPASGGLSYALFSDKIDLGAVIQASKSDSHSKYLASPVVMTMDNKEATIDATTKRQFITGWNAVSSSVNGSGLPTPSYSSENIGIEIKVTPKINPNGTVMLEVEEKYMKIGSKQSMLVPNGTSYDSRDVEIPTTRKMTSDVLLENLQTVVFSGLVESTITEDEAGIPLLKEIPIVGKWLFGAVDKKENRTELLVFMTPYVLKEGDEAEAEALRRKRSMSDSRPWDDRGWSKSKLADPVSEKEQVKKMKEEWQKLDEERAANAKLEEEKMKRAEELKERYEAEIKEKAKK